MPHVIVKLWPGKSEDQKQRLADRIAKDVMDVLDYGEESVSVAMEEVSSQDWAEQVYKPDIEDKGTSSTRNPVTRCDRTHERQDINHERRSSLRTP